jgi:hypothetical protein
MNIENNKELNNYITKYYNQIDNIYIDKFWSSINNKHWIYVDDMLIEWIGYNKTNGKQKYINLIKDNFKENDDYKTYNYEEINKIFHSPLEVNEDNKEIIEFKDKLKEVHNRTLHLILSPKCFKKSLMMIRTERANTIRDYYVDIEEICLEFNKYLLENNKKELEEKENIINEQKEEINNVKERIIDLSNHLYKYQELKENTYLYVATNKHLSLQNNFKIGVSTQLTKRLINYNCNNNKNDLFYFTYVKKIHNAYIVEYMIKHILKQFKNANNNEIFVINHNYLINILDHIINNYTNIISYYNLLMKDYVIDNTTNNQIPEAIDINIFDKIYYPTDDILLDKILEDNETETIYFNNNQEYPYLKYKNENNKNLFKCLRCNYIFNRIDNLQNHFNRQNKCFEIDKNNELEEIKNNNENPIIKSLEDSENYTYYEKYNYDSKSIEYYCNNCDYSTNNFNIFKNHYLKRKTKCYDEIIITNQEILKYIHEESNEIFEYKKLKTNEYKCNHCDYTGSKDNVIRHFNKKITCKQLQNSQILKETDKSKYYIIYNNQKKTYKCYYCNYVSNLQNHITRHQNKSINKCH